jgi:FAD binding domain
VIDPLGNATRCLAPTGHTPRCARFCWIATSRLNLPARPLGEAAFLDRPRFEACAVAIVYRPLDSLLLTSPWYRGRAIQIGDVAHATTPHMAAGALIGIQDAVVLTEELQREQSVDAALEAFMARRYERCKMLVERHGRARCSHLARALSCHKTRQPAAGG